ncbi:hypothetical protein JCM12856_20970 [Spirochaeta dissipatitropha]
MKDSDPHRRLEEIASELSRIDEVRKQLIAERTQLQKDIQKPQISNGYFGQPALTATPETPEEKIQLFLTLFGCREDVYPRFWSNTSSGKSGYSPVCANEWRPGICEKPRIKCRACRNAAFLPFDRVAVEKHLLGQEAIGVYAINEHDACVFLAADFDKDS